MNIKSTTLTGRQFTATRFCAGVCAALCLASATLARDDGAIVLPDLGDPSYSAMSLAEEKKLGRVILAQIRAQLPLVHDIELQSYLQSMGQRLLAYSDNGNEINFHFLLAKDNTINAFATPGGVIAVNAGLIAFSDDEDETAGVVAHEIAHVTRRHIARRYALSHQTRWVSALALIASLIAAAYNPDLGQLGVTSAASLPVEQQLAHSRAFEREADYTGMYLLNRASYDPRGMVDFFAKLQARETNYEVPEFLRTHPLNIERLQNMQARAARYPPAEPRDGDLFHYAKARLIALGHAVGTGQYPEPAHVKLYRKAIDLIAKRLPYQAIQTLEQIKGEHSHAVPVKLALAQAFTQQNNVKKAAEILHELNRLYPDNVSVNYYRVKLFLRTNRASEALTLLEDLAPLHAYYPELIKLSAQAAATLGKDSLSHEYLGEYNAANGNFKLALHQLQLAAKHTGENKVAKTRIEQKRKIILQLQEEMKQQ